MELAREIGDLGTVGIGYSNLGSNLMMVLSPQATLDALDEGREFSGRRGMGGNKIWLTAESTWALYDLGRWDELLERADEVAAFIGVSGAWVHGWSRRFPRKRWCFCSEATSNRPQPSWTELCRPRRAAGDLQVLVPALAIAAMVANSDREPPRKRRCSSARSRSITQVGSNVLPRPLLCLSSWSIALESDANGSRRNSAGDGVQGRRTHRTRGRRRRAPSGPRRRGESEPSAGAVRGFALPAGATTALCSVEQSRSSAPGVACFRSDERTKLRRGCAKRARSSPGSALRRPLRGSTTRSRARRASAPSRIPPREARLSSPAAAAGRGSTRRVRRRAPRDRRAAGSRRAHAG